MKSVRNAVIKNKTIILRVDFNVPINNGVIEDDNKIVQSLPTIKYLMDNEAKIVILSHLGKIKSEEDKAKNSLSLVSVRLSELIDGSVIFHPTTRGRDLEAAVRNLNPKEILLIQNTRYEDYPEKLESSCDQELSKYWASLGDIFVNDAFGSSHREHASTYGITEHLPSFAGFLLEREVTILENSLMLPKDLILGGSKIEDKLGVINNLLVTSNNILLGGAMCFTFLSAIGISVGKSNVDKSKIEYAKEIMAKAKEKIKLPVDIVTQNGIKELNEIEENDIGYDIGPKTIELYKKSIINSPLVIWNGPLGKFEEKEYENGTKEIMKFLYEECINVIIAGGDIGSASHKYNYEFYHISTGGGATLELLEGKKIKTLEALEDTNEENYI